MLPKLDAPENQLLSGFVQAGVFQREKFAPAPRYPYPAASNATPLTSGVVEYGPEKEAVTVLDPLAVSRLFLATEKMLVWLLMPRTTKRLPSLSKAISPLATDPLTIFRLVLITPLRLIALVDGS
ncbi:hypothetical protein KTJ89_12465 [Brevibacterium sediminis]|uniref:hypothetical protein n=1 Tax=Brevibacterium TaxID=1696 RepID=UPI0021755A83|nr:hypothetical protein [Brevibacterium sediminis]MCS4593793.1 hypothetical protein [Brevibacterium sediminis]